MMVLKIGLAQVSVSWTPKLFFLVSLNDMRKFDIILF